MYVIMMIITENLVAPDCFLYPGAKQLSRKPENVYSRNKNENICKNYITFFVFWIKV